VTLQLTITIMKDYEQTGKEAVSAVPAAARACRYSNRAD
jgi:hypothetical protein